MSADLEYLQANAVTITRGITDDETHFSRWTDYALADGSKYRHESSFAKRNPFAPPDDPESDVKIEVDGARLTRKAKDLVKIVGQHDDENEFTCWVEYYLPERTSLIAVHRSVNVTLKRPTVEATSAIGRLPGSPVG